jgi:hypothetical protein
MDHFELQRRLKEFDFYHGEVDGDIGQGSMQAIAAFLNNGRVRVPQAWSKQRRVLAAKQLVCRRDGIEVGAVDGLAGPQTQYAFQVYAERLAGGPSPLIPGRETDPPGPEPATAPPIWPRQADVETFFGPMGANQTRLTLPFAMRIAWEPSKLVKSIMVHAKVHDSAKRCFERIAGAYDAEARRRTGIELFGGCLNVRRMRGGNRWSMHSWGIAIDFDPGRNGLHSNRSNARLAQDDCRAFWRIWEDEGWISLGRTRDYDWMHVQAARL